MKKKICVVTGSRSEYGILYHTLKSIRASGNLELSLVVTGAHLSKKFGFTVDEIIKDGFKISDRVDMLMSSDSPPGIGKSIGVGVIGFVACFKRLKPDIVLLLGDRFEILSAATAAMALTLPIAHISGGDVTEYSVDEQIRHAITKMSHIHFASIGEHAGRIMQMGEEPWRVHITGELCIDNIRNMVKMPLPVLEDKLGTSLFPHPIMLVTFHAVTLQLKDAPSQIDNLLKALSGFDSKIIFTYPGADSGCRMIISRIERFVKRNSNAKAFKSLGGKLYLNLLSRADVVVGNSSSGIVEAPSFEVPVVNVGQRQDGRVMAKNVICVNNSVASITKGIRKALSPAFKNSLKGMKNPYDRKGAAKKIVKILSEIKTEPKLLNKKFVDLVQR